MAQLDVHGIDALLSKLDRLGRFEEVAPKMMEAGMEILQKEVVAEASKHKDTGEMAASIQPTGLTVSMGGSYYMCTRPTGYASGKGRKRKWKNARKGKGEGSGRARVRNMEKLIWLENGVKGRPATPVITKAVIRAEPQVIRAMRGVFERQVSGG